MYSHHKFLFLKFLLPWIKFDTVESINLIPIDRQNLLDFCPICLKSLGTKSTREHKLHDLTYHGRTEKDMYSDLCRASFLLIIIGLVVFLVLLFIFILPTDFVDDLSWFFYTKDVQSFIKSCQDIRTIYNDKLSSELDYSTFMLIKESEGICFDNLIIPYEKSNKFFVDRYYNLTDSSQNGQ